VEKAHLTRQTSYSASEAQNLNKLISRKREIGRKRVDPDICLLEEGTVCLKGGGCEKPVQFL